jgi:hypothetical protein
MVHIENRRRPYAVSAGGRAIGCKKSSKKRGLGSRGHQYSTRGADSFRGMSTNDPKGKKFLLSMLTLVYAGHFQSPKIDFTTTRNAT